MPTPQMPTMPGVDAMTDTLDFVKNLWGSMGVPGMNMPGMAAPTMSIDDLDKKIADLKAVEAWLNVNQSMLHGTIQALEVQRGTIATLKSMGESMAAAIQQPGASEKSVLAAAPYASAFFGQPVKPKSAEPEPPPPAAEANAAQAPAAASPMTNPTAWWNMLQDQFKQAVTTAMSPEAMAGASAMAQEAASKMAAATTAPAVEMGKAMASSMAKAATPAAKGASAKPKARPKNGSQ